MDPLDNLTTKADNLASDARIEFLMGHPIIVYEILGELYDLLDDKVGSGARDKCESIESSETD